MRILFHPVLMILLLLAAAPHPAQSQEDPGTVSLSAMVRDLQTALVTMQIETEEIYEVLVLDGVTLQLAVNRTKSGEGGLSLPVVEAGGSVGTDDTDTVTLSLHPPSPDAETEVSAEDLGRTLAALVSPAIEAMEIARTGTPPLMLDTLEIELAFVLEREGKAGVGFTFFGLGVKGEGTIGRGRTQKMLLRFRSKEAPK